MELIWAPWRLQYIEMPKPESCIFCTKVAQSEDRANYILYRGRHNFVILNLFPYNPGHTMVVPYRHIDTLEALTGEEVLEHWELMQKVLGAMRLTLRPAGFNTGMNLGRVAGAGIDSHIHTHIVPRWGGDTNFMPVVASTKVMSEALSSVYDKLKEKM